MKEGETLKLTGTSPATAYHFRPAVSNGCGWAICTVNDATGELQIMSDWGDWSYRWNVSALGPDSSTGEPLTRFLADPGHKHDHYLADKLTSSDRSKRESFDGEQTVEALREHLVDLFKQDDLRVTVLGNIFASPLEPEGRDRRRRMTGREFAALYKALAELEHIDDPRDFVDAFEGIGHHESLSDEPWDFFMRSPTSSYLVLLRTIIPALVDACTERVRAMPPIPSSPATQETVTP